MRKIKNENGILCHVFPVLLGRIDQFFKQKICHIST
jgi:hypothetical protein